VPARLPAPRPLQDLAPPPAPGSQAFAPPPRFSQVSFAGYRPQHPSQARARTAVETFVSRAREVAGRRRRPRWLGGRPLPGRGLYLDGGFGVGKTHLLASAYLGGPVAPSAYLSFQELVYVIGVQGHEAAQRGLGRARLLCLDEFELDDPGNTLLVKRFLAGVFEAGGWVLTTSNTPPEAQGQGRFNAEDFRREIQSVARHFQVLRIDGPDYRHRLRVGTWLPRERFARLVRGEPAPAPRVFATWGQLLALLGRLHPSRYGGVLQQIGTLYLADVAPIAGQHDALRFVHFIDKLYDLGTSLRASGRASLSELFDASYRNSGYAKKHERCLSRLSELLAEAPTGAADEARGAPASRAAAPG